MTDNDIEKEIKAKGLAAPRITPEDIEAKIVSESFVILGSGKSMVCELVLENGYSVRGEASVVSPENFDVEIGKKISRADAKNKIWVLEGYLLQEKLYRKGKV